MEHPTENAATRRLEPFVGASRLPGGGRTVYEWLPGGRFLVQRSEVPIPDVPDGIAITGFDPSRGADRHRYFDSRGVSQLYEMTSTGAVWTLRREAGRRRQARHRKRR